MRKRLTLAALEIVLWVALAAGAAQVVAYFERSWAADERSPALATLRWGTYPLILCHMAQLTIYLPEPTIRRAKREARKRGQSVSAYVAQLVEGGGKKRQAWPRDFLETFGAWRGRFPKIEKLPAEERESFD